MNQNITALDNTPLNRLFIAINHYVSTGDHLGEGMSVPEGPQKVKVGEPHPKDKLRILLLVNSGDKTDLADFEKFKSRFTQVASGFSTMLESGGTQKQFFVYSFVIQYGQADKLAQSLIEEPGPLGWGSMKPLIDKYFPG